MTLESRQSNAYFFRKELRGFVKVGRTGDTGEVEFQNEVLSVLTCAILAALSTSRS